MWSAGIAWDRHGYEVACASDVRQEPPISRFQADHIHQIAGYIRAVCGAEGTVVVDSTNGLLDGPLRAAGFRVLRADPGQLPPGASDRSAEATALAHSGLECPDSLVETDDIGGTLTGRFQALRDNAQRSALAARDLGEPGRYLVSGPPQSNRVALTFDDGPTAPHTDRVLDILRDYQVHATFFCVGLHAAASPGTIARIADNGHNIGNHTWSHPFLPDLSRDAAIFQFEAANATIEAVTGSRPTLLRPPYGVHTPESLKLTVAHDMTTVLWDVDTEDWAMPGSEAIAANALNRACGGSIVLMHDGGGERAQSVEALPKIIESLLAERFELVTVDRLLEADSDGREDGRQDRGLLNA